MTALLLALLATAPDAGRPDAGTPDAGVPLDVIAELRRLAHIAEKREAGPQVKKWLAAVDALKHVEHPVTLACTKDRQTCVPPEKAPVDAGFQVRVGDDEYVYARIADGLGYTRAYEVLEDAGVALDEPVLDFGYGNISQLVMLAQIGADVHGVEVDSMIPVATKGLVGPLSRHSGVTLHHGYFMSDPRLVKEMTIRGGYALWMSKNTLKRGYVHPAEPPGKKAQIDLGASDDKVLSTIFGQLRPGGFFYIYNIGPRQQTPYIEMADIRCPFSVEALKAAGFEVLAYDVEDSARMREIGHWLEWDSDGTNIDAEYFSMYTLARRPNRK